MPTFLGYENSRKVVPDLARSAGKLQILSLGGGIVLCINERRRELARLIDVEDRMFVEVEGQPRVYAIADEDLNRETDEKTSAVHFLRFEFTAPMRAALLAGAGVKLGCDHTNYPQHCEIAPEQLASLVKDIRP